MRKRFENPRMFGWVWLGLCIAFAVHVIDEAATDFLSVYNPTVVRIREVYPFIPLPTFTFRWWLALLIFAVAVLTALSPQAFRGRWGITLVQNTFLTLLIRTGA